ncbi:MAG: UDP-N-acetylmuramoyl-tripeptide--D-alanyl-D-alanine ligase [Christensenellales bacterium]|jgi:UDP-N-acetylmuramoyl-tripeptide--D-alanyl-D-alanine ligase
MRKWTIQDIVSACSGTFVGNTAELDTVVEHIVIDSREAGAHSLYIPIVGERLDGHSFIQDAYDRGAVCCLSQQSLDTGRPFIRVEDTRLAFQRIAYHHRARFGVKMVGITGSVGKTTTKELVACVLAQQYRVLKTEGNFNNQTGVPLTLLRLNETHEVGVLELGTNHFGEIRSLSHIVRPDVCVFTNIGDSHLEYLGSREGVFRAKREMLEYASRGAHIIANGDDAFLATLRESEPNVTLYGLGSHNDVIAQDLREQDVAGISFTAVSGADALELFVPSPGRHMVYNALAAVAVGRALGVAAQKIQAGIASFTTQGDRMRVQKSGGITILNDVYNANPNSMRAALDVLRNADGRRICVLGDMLELGEKSGYYHEALGAYAAGMGIDVILCTGAMGKTIYEGAVAAGAENAFYCLDQEKLWAALSPMLKAGDTVLVKASRGVALEHTVERLIKHGPYA